MPSGRRVALLLLLVAVYFVAGRFGLSLALVHESASAVWPPTGIAIAACILAGSWIWPAVFAGAFLVNLTTTQAALPSLLIAAGNTCEAVLAATLVHRFAAGPQAFHKTSRIFIFIGAAALASAVAATVGLVAIVLGDVGREANPGMTWLTWWAGDLSGALLVAPTIVTIARRPRMPWHWPRRAELALLVATLAAAGYWVYGPSVAGLRSYPLIFVMLPVQLWAALRFGLRGATSSVLITAVIATAGTLEGLGPFARWSSNESLLLLEAYLCVKMMVMLSLAAEVGGRRTAERELRELNAELARRVDARSEELLRLHGRLVEAQHVASIGSWEWDIGADTIWWSDEMYRLFGVPVGSPMTYDRFLSLVDPEDRRNVDETVRRSLETGEPFTFEHRAVTPDGTIRVLHAHGRIISNDAGHPIRMFGVGHDITGRKRAEEERLELVQEQLARREAEESSRMKDTFLATLSHELRTPLNAILGWSQLLQQNDLDDGMRARATEAIQRNVAVQAQLVSDILDVTRIRSGLVSIEARPTPVQAILDSAVDIMRRTLEMKRIELSADVPEALAVMGDAPRLQQVLWNLLSNAAKFVPEGGHIMVSARRDGDAAEIQVADDGPGIDRDFLPYVFEPFRQADPSNTREHGGLGLGLSISQSLVQQHGGTIAAANRVGGGAVFTIRLPAAPLT